jgi:DNA modification methylase
VYLTDCVELMRLMPPECVDVIFADPPYRLSGSGVTVKSGELAPWIRASGTARWASSSISTRPACTIILLLVRYR